jgi:hypothetical protein
MVGRFGEVPSPGWFCRHIKKRAQHRQFALKPIRHSHSGTLHLHKKRLPIMAHIRLIYPNFMKRRLALSTAHINK